MEYKLYAKLPWPNYQELMETHDWSETIACEDGDVLIPYEWIKEKGEKDNE